VSFETIFMFELLLVAVVVTVILGGVIHLATRDRRARHETGREVGKADVTVGTAPEEPTEDTVERASRQPRREFYKSMGLETTEDMKIRLYSIDEYRNELSGTHAGPDGRFVAATKAYRQLDDEWYDYSPRKAADVLELAPEDYVVDGECLALLLKRLPPGLPTSARDVL
jgi:hypothetical protein